MLKLAHYGIRNSMLKWKSAFLSSHALYKLYEVDASYSGPAEVLSSVPQGTALWPLCSDVPGHAQAHIEPSKIKNDLDTAT